MKETERSIAILGRLRGMLLRQRDKFRSYLTLLEQEELAIVEGDADKLQVHVELEKSIIAEIFTLKRVIAPLQDLYQAAYPAAEATIPELESTLNRMGQQVIARNARNRALLREKVDELRQEIKTLRTWPKGASLFAEVAPSLVDITT